MPTLPRAPRSSLGALCLLAIAAAPRLADAGAIGIACMRSDRPTVSRQLCTCIDQVARTRLSAADQRRAARFFRDPDDAQAVRMHKSDAANAFWRRYRAFAANAEQLCRR